MDKIAIVTGYSSGIGKAIVSALKQNQIKTIKLTSRLQDTTSLEKEIDEILSKTEVNYLINCAGKGIFRPHEEISVSSIKDIIDTNLTAPIILTKLLLRSLKKTQGHIINISSIEALRHSKFSALYTATKSGLRDFSLALFEELRKADVKVCSINPDMVNGTRFFDDLNFYPNEDCSISPKEIADIVVSIINMPSTVTDITIRPQKIGIIKKGKNGTKRIN